MQDKRGLSAIVATLIIILLVLVAAGIIWVVVRNIITKGAEGIELERFTLDLSIKSAYIDGTNVKVLVRRSPGGGDLIGVKFIFFNSTDSIIVNRNIPLIELQERLFSFDSSEVGDINALQEVSVAPIYESSSGEETVGDITDTATISSSLPPGGNGNGDNGDNGGNGDNGEPPVPDSCDGVWNQTDIDAGIECDGGINCNPDCTCSVGFTADGAGGCDLDSPVNNGTIYSVWPIGAVKYFDSEDLPIDVSGYTMYYVNFSNSEENGCFRITWAEYMETNGRSYIRTEFIVNISVGEGYSVWEAENCGA
ncbi:hypothetical protein ES703_119945 [subsurface metagenome]